jgi:hypothetical protein
MSLRHGELLLVDFLFHRHSEPIPVILSAAKNLTPARELRSFAFAHDDGASSHDDDRLPVGAANNLTPTHEFTPMIILP